jgi:hypothetical protein
VLEIGGAVFRVQHLVPGGGVGANF